MKQNHRISAFVTACGLVVCSSALAQQSNTTGQIEELKKAQQELNEELAALKAEMQGLRADLAQMAATLKTVQTRQKSAARPARPAMSMVGKEAPKFVVTTFDGKQATVGGQRDKPQVVFCYASWCGFCRKSLPWIESLHKNYKDKGVEVVAVNLDTRGDGGRARTEEQTLTQYRDMKLSMPMTMTTAKNDTKKIGTAYKAKSFPTLFVLGKTGTVESVHIGAKAGLEKMVGTELDLLLAGKTRADFPK